MDETNNTLSLEEEQAFQLSRCAIEMDQTRNNPKKLVHALDKNLYTWVALKTILKQKNTTIDSRIRDNISTLGNFIAATTFSTGTLPEQNTLDTLININLQISEGLLESKKKKQNPTK